MDPRAREKLKEELTAARKAAELAVEKLVAARAVALFHNTQLHNKIEDAQGVATGLILMIERLKGGF